MQLGAHTACQATLKSIQPESTGGDGQGSGPSGATTLTRAAQPRRPQTHPALVGLRRRP